MNNKIVKKNPIDFEIQSNSISKSKDIKKVERSFKSELNKIKEGVEEVYRIGLDNGMVYESEFNFEPLIGESYYLYEREDGSRFLSLIGPSEWGIEKRLKYIGEFTLDEKMLFKKEP